MPRFLEKKLEAEYGKDSDVPYKVMNRLGFMNGSKETKKGAEAEKKHDSMGHQHKSKPVTEQDKHMSVRHKQNRKNIKGMASHESEEGNLTESNNYNEMHAREHIEQIKKNNRLLDNKQRNKNVDHLLRHLSGR